VKQHATWLVTSPETRVVLERTDGKVCCVCDTGLSLDIRFIGAVYRGDWAEIGMQEFSAPPPWAVRIHSRILRTTRACT